MQLIENVVIAAAGMGARIGLGIPKCMIDIEGTNLLSRLINLLDEYCKNIVVVVGYREEMVVEYCSVYHRNVIIARNPNYATTNTAYSYHQGAKNLVGKTLYIDGDLLVENNSMLDFLKAASSVDVLIGVAKANSEQAVYVGLEGDSVTYFNRNYQGEEYEWANVFVAPSNFLKKIDGYVFESIELNLPLPSKEIVLREVDTKDDLEQAILFCRSW